MLYYSTPHVLTGGDLGFFYCKKSVNLEVFDDEILGFKGMGNDGESSISTQVDRLSWMIGSQGNPSKNANIQPITGPTSIIQGQV
jgi:hypothetical protein